MIRDRLSPRQREVMNLAADGRTNKEIARALAMSPTTARDHLHQAYKKLNARNRVEATLIWHGVRR